MIRLGVQGVEVVMLRFDFRPIGQSKTQTMKNIGDPI
jgi:alpha/beta superfamily hydrolase